MAERPIFIPSCDGLRLVREIMVAFTWHPGFAPVQKKKNITALHAAAKIRGHDPLLEISTKSDSKLGQRLSAFNLKVTLCEGREIPLESAFQGSKIFEHGGPYTDLYEADARTAKRDPRLRSSGKIIAFEFKNYRFPAEPKTAFYNWLYVQALAPHRSYLGRLKKFAGFTDVEFNPEHSINCQARSCAVFMSLVCKNLLDYCLQSPEHFIEVVAPDAYAQSYSRDVPRGRLL
jgi:hypothetical protein